MCWRPVLPLLFATACLSHFSGVLRAADEPAAAPNVTIQTVMERFRQPVESIRFATTPLPDALAEIARRSGLPLVVDDSVQKLSPMPTLTLSVSGINTRQLLDVVAACTHTALWIDPPGYERGTPIRILWTTRFRAQQLAEAQRWKSQTVDVTERADAALRERTELAFADTPLNDVLEFFRDYHQVPIVYAGPAELTRSLITLELPATSLRAALDLLLPPLDLGFVVKNGAIHVVSREQALLTPITRVYVVPEWIGRDQNPEALQNAFQSAAGANPSPEASVTWLNGVVAVTAAEEQHGRIELFVARLRTAVKSLTPPTELRHAPGQLPEN